MDKCLVKFESHKKECREAQDKAIAKHLATQKEEGEKLVKFLTELGATEIWSNDYAFTFNYADRRWTFVNQGSRIVINFNRIGLGLGDWEPTGTSHCIDGNPLKALKLAIRTYAYICPVCHESVAG